MNARGIPPARGRKMLTPPRWLTPPRLDLTPPADWLPPWLDLTPPGWTWPPPAAGPDPPWQPDLTPPPQQLDLTPPPAAGPDPSLRQLDLTPPPGWTEPPPPQVLTKWKHYLPHPSDAGGKYVLVKLNSYLCKISLLCKLTDFSVSSWVTKKTS